MAQTGGTLFDSLSQMAGGVIGVVNGVDLSTLNGTSTDVAIQQIVQALQPNNPDAEKISAALNAALAECLEGQATFDFNAITTDMLAEMMMAYVTHCVFEQVVMDSDRAFQKSESPSEIQKAENALLELTREVVEQKMGPTLATGTNLLNANSMRDVQLKAIEEVWAVWESY